MPKIQEPKRPTRKSGLHSSDTRVGLSSGERLLLSFAKRGGGCTTLDFVAGASLTRVK